MTTDGPDLDPADPDAPTGGEPEAAEDDSILDRLRGAGVGVEDPNIVGDPEPGLVDAEIAEDEPPVV